MSLKDQLNQCSVDFESKQPDMAKVFCQFINELEDSGLIYNILKEGDAVPDFTLVNISGDEVSLEQLLAKQKLIITFYRGGWCPYCSLELQAWQGVYSQLIEKDTELVAISPEKPESSSMSGSQKNLSFETLYDKGNSLARKFGLVFEVKPNVTKLYESLGIDLVALNGDQNHELPIPATYIIGRDKKILDAFIDVDYRNRKDPEEILELL